MSRDLFINKFLSDEDQIAIPISKYALRYSIDKNTKDFSISYWKNFIVQKAIESEESFEIIRDSSNKELLLGTVQSHRVFYDWLMNESI